MKFADLQLSRGPVERPATTTLIRPAAIRIPVEL
jgi:hypothetical protein